MRIRDVHIPTSPSKIKMTCMNKRRHSHQSTSISRTALSFSAASASRSICMQAGRAACSSIRRSCCSSRASADAEASCAAETLCSQQARSRAQASWSWRAWARAPANATRRTTLRCAVQHRAQIILFRVGHLYSQVPSYEHGNSASTMPGNIENTQQRQRTHSVLARSTLNNCFLWDGKAHAAFDAG